MSGSHPSTLATYTASDGRGGTATATVTVTVSPAPTQTRWVVNVGDPGYSEAGLYWTTGYGTDVDLDVIRAWWSLRCLLAVRWLGEHGWDPWPELGVLTSGS